MSANNNNSSNGIGFLGLLTVLFVGLKLTNFIDWSWWWILAPIWAPIIIFLLGGLVVLLIALIAGIFKL